jgi:hypothetical protein
MLFPSDSTNIGPITNLEAAGGSRTKTAKSTY